PVQTLERSRQLLPGNQPVALVKECLSARAPEIRGRNIKKRRFRQLALHDMPPARASPVDRLPMHRITCPSRVIQRPQWRKEEVLDSQFSVVGFWPAEGGEAMGFARFAVLVGAGLAVGVPAGGQTVER